MRFLPLALLLLCLTCLSVSAAWEPTRWHGERSWKSTSNGWTVIVSEERSRLVSLAPSRGGRNLLYAEKKRTHSWGGHRFWLGPQSGWQSDWPPPKDWEESAAASVKLEGDTLVLKLPHTDLTYPALERRYFWQGADLHCVVTMNPSKYFSIHIIQVPKQAVIFAAPTTEFVKLSTSRKRKHERSTDWPAEITTPGPNAVTFQHRGPSSKIGVPPGSLTAQIGKYTLTMRRGKFVGTPVKPLPDLGFLTQVFIGDSGFPLLEMEQVFPALRGNRRVSSEVILRPSGP